MIKIGQVIKQLRVQHSITQEKLADYLNVSPQSVSKWENGLSYPDITLVPSIAGFFNVSTDELFSLNAYNNNQKFIEYEQKYKEYQQKVMVVEQIKLCRQMFLEYPRNYRIMSDLADSLVRCYEGLENLHHLAVQQNYIEEAIKLSELILQDCHDLELKLNATKILCQYYPKVGQKDKAIELVNKLHQIEYSKEILLEDVLTDEACIKQQQENLFKYMSVISDKMIHLSFLKGKNIPDLTIEEKIDFVSKANQMYQLIIDDGNYLGVNQKLAWNYRRLAELYLAQKDQKQCIENLKLAYKYAKAYDTLPDTSEYTGRLISKCVFDKKAQVNKALETECEVLFYRLTKQGTFDMVQEDEEVQTLIQLLIDEKAIN